MNTVLTEAILTVGQAARHGEVTTRVVSLEGMRCCGLRLKCERLKHFFGQQADVQIGQQKFQCSLDPSTIIILQSIDPLNETIFDHFLLKMLMITC